MFSLTFNTNKTMDILKKGNQYIAGGFPLDRERLISFLDNPFCPHSYRLDGLDIIIYIPENLIVVFSFADFKSDFISKVTIKE